MNRMLNLFTITFIALLAFARASWAGDELILFHAPPDQSDVAREVHQDLLPRLQELAEELDLTLRTVDVTEAGAPEEITITPLIAFQTARGRSIYSGRYTTIDRIRNFVTTSRMIPQSNAPTVRESIPTWSVRGTTIAAPVKITTLNGFVPRVFDQSKFERAMTDAIARGMDHFQLSARTELDRSDRSFYIDFHPYLDGNGTLFVSIEAYSQFNCHDPIFSQLSDPVKGSWDERESVFAEAAAVLENAIVERISSASHGDGFDVIVRGDGMASPSWNALGLALPEASATDGEVITLDPDVLMQTREWVVDDAASKRVPPVIFRFPAPLDHYSGQVPDLSGTFAFLPSALDATEASGQFTAFTPTITMGEPMLDETIRGSMILNTKVHTESTFVMTGLSPASTERALAFGTATPVILDGRFTMRGVTMPLQVLATLEPVVNGDGELRVVLSAEWSIQLLEPFGIEGPDGPAPENDTLLYSATITLRPVE